MGGQALKNTYTRRYDAKEYHALASEVESIMDNVAPQSLFCVIDSYRDKETFGDLDMLIDSTNLPSNYINRIIEHFHPNEWVKNGNCLSFDYKSFQIDLIVTPRSEFFTSMQYFAYNDLGNLLGRVAHTMGLKFGHDGLSYNWRVGTYQFRNEIILTDMIDILLVMGYDPAIWLRGFNTMEDIFRFVVSSPFFNKAIYQLNNRNHAARIRDQKRKTYMEFLKWIETYEETDEQKEYAAWHDLPEREQKWLKYISDTIPHFQPLYERVNGEWERAKRYRERFNGSLVRDWTGADGIALGDFMKGFKGDLMFQEFVERHT